MLDGVWPQGNNGWCVMFLREVVGVVRLGLVVLYLKRVLLEGNLFLRIGDGKEDKKARQRWLRHITELLSLSGLQPS